MLSKMVSNSKISPPTTTITNKLSKISFFLLLILLPFLYIFLLHLPPSSLLHDTVFWFLISNSIIIIVAADSGIFTSSSSDNYIYDEYVKHSKPVVPVPVPVPVQDKKEEIHAHRIEDITNTNDVDNGMSPTTIAAPAKSQVDDGQSHDLQLSKCERSVAVVKMESDHNHEYLKMSDEELNRRVEEFIRKFNREIRLQGKLTRTPTPAAVCVS